MIGRFVATAATVLVVATMLFSSASAQQSPRALIENLGGEAIRVLANKEATAEEKHARFEALFGEGFDVPLVARIVLGRYWRSATPEQRDEYVELFRRYVIDTYTARLNAYSGQTFDVTGEQELSDDETLVRSIIKDPGGPALKVDWRVLTDEAEPRIVDVIVEGVSMAITHRSEFASVINQSGGIEGLLEKLRAQTGQG